ncbi:MAG: CocE/NonD family hydrolase [Candidatus Eremiobacteraeota bacterium]|nr:CocE/NonD family hydrolase [Candidatus Eremiobacteraeota bacterium]
MIPTVVVASAPYAVVRDMDVRVRMRDGTVLVANVFRPKARGRFPVLLCRTPYGKNNADEFVLRAAARGYVAIVEDVRGRYGSSGAWYPFANEENDGYDTVEWAAGLPYADGRVAMYGDSYAGAAQWYAAIAQPPHLVAIAPLFAPSNYHEDTIYQGGAFEQLLAQSWVKVLARNGYDQGYGDAPVVDLPLLRDPYREVPYYSDWLEHPNDDPYWSQLSIGAQYDRIRVPAFIVGGWYDPFVRDSLRQFHGMRGEAATLGARMQTRLTIVAGGHSGEGDRVGAIDFGSNANVEWPGGPYELYGAMLSWFDWVLRGGSREDDSLPLHYFVLGENAWNSARDWPPAGANQERLYLHSEGRANGVAGDGSLLSVSPATEPPDRFTYDPSNPVPTVGGALCCAQHPGSLAGSGPQDQSAVERRADVLVFSTPPLTRRLIVAGEVSISIVARSDAVDTDFTAKLVDVWPNGFAQNLCDGITRGRYRRSALSPRPLRPDEPSRYSIDLGPIAALLAPGHRLRLEISSSNFPRFSRNLNEYTDQATAATFRVAHNEVLHDRTSPSYVTLGSLPEGTANIETGPVEYPFGRGGGIRF